MSKHEKKYLETRHWLNPKWHDDTGMLGASVVFKNYGFVDANLGIWDCSRRIDLDFSFDPTKDKEVKQRVEKIDRVIKTLTEMRASMEKAYLENRLRDCQEDED